ncbi:DUF3073 domain-containing protein [Nocardia sp. NPDC059240]|uniref:DUF3073 domain-containing protein n=1 Tax=Nocardia sp. NPDC059240 TaxID=3346786 RepID=UPI0036A3565C
MGRGRAKAKQTKVARELKYSSPSTDFTSLQRELAAPSDTQRSGASDTQRSGVLSEEHDASESRSTSWEEEDSYDDWRR